MPRLSRSVIVSAVVATLLVAVGMWMVMAGWPMETPAQVALIDLAQLPISTAVLVAIIQMAWERRLWLRHPVRRVAAVFAPGAVMYVAGLVLLLVAFAGPARHLVTPALLLIWTGLGVAFLYLAADSVRRELGATRSQLAPVGDDGDFDDLWDDEEADESYADEPLDPLDAEAAGGNTDSAAASNRLDR